MTVKRTKIVCTLGPSTDSVDTLAKLLDAGMNVARFNFSHGDHEEHKSRIDKLEEASKRTGKRVAKLLDTKGPEIRTGVMKEAVVTLEKGATVRVSMDPDLEGDAEVFSVSYPGLINDVEVDGHILIDDGLVDLLITDIDKENNEIVTTVLNTGIIKSRKGVNVPNVSLGLPGLTEKDASDIRFGAEMGYDFIAQSFVRTASDVLEVRKLLKEIDAEDIHIISKIENQEGFDNIDEIIEVSDGIMVARGDLGVEVPAEEVPIMQKTIIRKCNEAGKPVITATQMLDSMQHSPRPTRAEAGDVANAILDGTDAVMLSGETAAGEYPVEAVTTMANICLRTEEVFIHDVAYSMDKGNRYDNTEAISLAVGHTARNLEVPLIVASTYSGHTARLISKYRPQALIAGTTYCEKVARKLMLVWGVQPYVVDIPESTDDMFATLEDFIKEEGLAEEGDLAIITAGVPTGQQGTTNMMKILEVGK